MSKRAGTVDADAWDWGVVVTPRGEVIPPGACDGLHNKDKQRDPL